MVRFSYYYITIKTTDNTGKLCFMKKTNKNKQNARLHLQVNAEEAKCLLNTSLNRSVSSKFLYFILLPLIFFRLNAHDYEEISRLYFLLHTINGIVDTSLIIFANMSKNITVKRERITNACRSYTRVLHLLR